MTETAQKYEYWVRCESKSAARTADGYVWICPFCNAAHIYRPGSETSRQHMCISCGAKLKYPAGI